MNNNRRGLDVGRGSGYRNVVGYDSHVHSLSARGVKTYSQLYATNVSPEAKKNILADIANKAVTGVKSAIKWEQEHYPQQEQWVKDEYNKIKTEAIKIRDNAVAYQKEQAEKAKGQAAEAELEQQGFEVYNEGDPIRQDEDYVDPVPMPMLPFAMETEEEQPQYEPESEYLPVEEESDSLPVPMPFESVPEAPAPQPEKQPNIIQKVQGYVQEKREKAEQRRKELDAMSDAELRDLAIKTPTGFFGGSNEYETELFRREEEKKRIDSKILQIRSSPVKKDSMGGVDLGFLNPFAGDAEKKDSTPSGESNLPVDFSFLNPFSGEKQTSIRKSVARRPVPAMVQQMPRSVPVRHKKTRKHAKKRVSKKSRKSGVTNINIKLNGYGVKQ